MLAVMMATSGAMDNCGLIFWEFWGVGMDISVNNGDGLESVGWGIWAGVFFLNLHFSLMPWFGDLVLFELTGLIVLLYCRICIWASVPSIVQVVKTLASLSKSLATGTSLFWVFAAYSVAGPPKLLLYILWRMVTSERCQWCFWPARRVCSAWWKLEDTLGYWPKLWFFAEKG